MIQVRRCLYLCIRSLYNCIPSIARYAEEVRGEYLGSYRHEMIPMQTMTKSVVFIAAVFELRVAETKIVRVYFFNLLFGDLKRLGKSRFTSNNG